MSSQTALTPKDCLILMAVALTWGLNTVLSKVGVDAMPPLLFATLRFVVVVLVSGWMLKPVGLRWKPVLLIAMLTGPIHYGIQFPGLKMAEDLSPMVIAMQLWVPFSVLFAAVFLKEKIPQLRLTGLIVSFAGIVILAFEPSVLRQLDAFLLTALAAAAYAGASVLMSRFGSLDPIQMQVWVALASVPFLAGGSAVFETGQVAAIMSAPAIIWFAIAFAAIGSSLLANSAMWTLIQKHPVSAITPWLQVSPISAVVLGVWLLGDPMTLQLLAGIGVSMAGFFIVALARKS